MAGRQLAFWDGKGLDVYAVQGGSLKRTVAGAGIAGGPAKKGRTAEGLPARNVLVLGSGSYIRIRKRYPPAKLEKLVRAVEMESAEMVPFTRPAVYCRIFAAYQTHVLLDVWAWEQELAERLAPVFPHRYIIPEDLAFASDQPVLRVHVYRNGMLVRIMACRGPQFVDAVSYPEAAFSSGDLARFLAGLAADPIDEIRIHGDIPAEIPAAFQSLVQRIPAKDHPPFLDELMSLSGKQLRAFRAGGASGLVLNRALLWRSAIYAAAAYGLFLFVSMKNYDSALQEARAQSAAVDRRISALQAGAAQEEEALLRELHEKLKGTVTPLRAIEILAAELPEGASATSLTLNEGMAEVTVAAREPLSVIKRLSESRQVRRVSLKGSPARDAQTGIYSCALILEMLP